MTKDQVAYYLDVKGTRCPHCQSIELSTASEYYDVQPDVMEQEVQCDKCGSTWTDQYQLVGVYDGDE